jgi:hypothetical protein
MTSRYSVGHASVREGKMRLLYAWHLSRSATPAGGLIASVKEQLRYDPPHLETRAELLRAPDGSVAWLRFGGRIRRRA